MPLQIAVNLSPAQFMHGDVVGLVHSILLETGLAPDRLELEITEGVLIEDFDRGLALLRRLKALGVRISMDDFGSGYSSLSYLQAFPFDKIKIDRAFVINLGRNPQSASIVRAVIGLGHGLEMSIVAEGVETQEQLAFLADEGCDAVQGYFLGKPLPIGQYAALVGRNPRRDGARAQDRLAVAHGGHRSKYGVALRPADCHKCKYRVCADTGRFRGDPGLAETIAPRSNEGFNPAVTVWLSCTSRSGFAVSCVRGRGGDGR